MVTRRNLLKAGLKIGTVGGLSAYGIHADMMTPPTVQTANWAFDSFDDVMTVTLYGQLSDETRSIIDMYARIDTGRQSIDRSTSIGKGQSTYAITFVIDETKGVYEDTIEIEKLRVMDE